MKLKRTIIAILACVMALLLFVTSCGKGETTESKKPSDTKPSIKIEKTTKPDPPQTSEPEAEPTTEPTDEPATEKTDPKPSSGGDDNADAVEATTVEEAADLGVWVATKKNGKDMVLGDIRYRVTSLTDDQDAIMDVIEDYNEDDDNFRKVETDLPENYVLKLCEYEVFYAKDYPGYGDEGNTIYSPDLYFSIASEDGGGLDTADGFSHIGLSCIDISKKVDSITAGDTFSGLVVYAIPNNAIEQYYLSYYYSDKDADDKAVIVYSYVKPEEIKVE
ncbi:MAG: hypothetical protein ACOX36_00175 [Saccharofermentanales bacterium]|jgi:hypothetical protein